MAADLVVTDRVWNDAGPMPRRFRYPAGGGKTVVLSRRHQLDKRLEVDALGRVSMTTASSEARHLTPNTGSRSLTQDFVSTFMTRCFTRGGVKWAAVRGWW